jgi:hypothetical protein
VGHVRRRARGQWHAVKRQTIHCLERRLLYTDPQLCQARGRHAIQPAISITMLAAWVEIVFSRADSPRGRHAGGGRRGRGTLGPDEQHESIDQALAFIAGTQLEPWRRPASFRDDLRLS